MRDSEKTNCATLKSLFAGQQLIGLHVLFFSTISVTLFQSINWPCIVTISRDELYLEQNNDLWRNDVVNILGPLFVFLTHVLTRVKRLKTLLRYWSLAVQSLLTKLSRGSPFFVFFYAGSSFGLFNDPFDYTLSVVSFYFIIEFTIFTLIVHSQYLSSWAFSYLLFTFSNSTIYVLFYYVFLEWSICGETKWK